MSNTITLSELKKKREKPGKYIMIDVRQGAELEVQAQMEVIARYLAHPTYHWYV